MGGLAPGEITVMFLSLGILLGMARLLGELAQRLRQPSVVGEMLAGILLGPTVLGTFAPQWSAFLFPSHGANAVTLDGFATLAIALVIMALVTSMMSGPAMQLILQLRKPRRLLEAFSASAFLRELNSASRREAIHELTGAACAAGDLAETAIETAVWAREEAMPTGIGRGIALPHARLPGLREPLVAVGFSEAGIDFDAPDGEPAHGIFPILTPQNDPSAQLRIAAELSCIFQDRQMLAKALRVKNFAEFLVLMKSATSP